MTRAALRASPWDALFVALAVTYGAALLLVPSIPLVAVGLWWTANTIAHNFIHRPFFAHRWANRAFSLLITLVMGIPQTLWRQRHLAHHAGRGWQPRWEPMLGLEAALVGGIWIWLGIAHPFLFATIYLPGYAIGLLLCALHGHYEHVFGTTSHYGRLYNVLFFNDGYHVEHHANPRLHWTELPGGVTGDTQTSRWPAAFRWFEGSGLYALEKVVLRSPALQRFVLSRHRHALAPLLATLPDCRTVAVVGGGLFPRTALILRELLPATRLVVIDADERHLAIARAHFGVGDVDFRYGRYPWPGSEQEFDLVIIPLSFHGDRERLYDRPPARAVAVHDWLWQRRGTSRVVSTVLLKRLNLVLR